MPAASLAHLALRQLAHKALVLVDATGMVVAWSQGAQELLGWTAEQRQDTPLAELFSHATLPAFLNEPRPSAATARHSCWLQDREGGWRWVDVNCQRLDDGALRGTILTLQDRTEELVAEERLRLAQQVGQVGTYEALRTGTWIKVSSGFCRLWGLAEQDGYTLDALRSHLHPEQPNRAELDFDTAAYREYRILRADTGEERWLAHRGHALEQPGKQRYLGVCYDLTDRKRAETAIAERDLRLHELYHGMSEGFFIAQALRDDNGQVRDFRFLEINPAFSSLTGIAPERVLGRTLHEVFTEPPPGLLDTCVDFLGSHAEFIQFDGHVTPSLDHWYDIRAHRLPEDRFAVLFVDINNQRRQAQELARNEAQLRAIINSIDQMVWTCRPDGFHFYFNERWYEFTGMPSGSTEGDAWSDLFHPEDRARTWKVWQHSLASGEPYHAEYRLKHRSGRYRWVLGRALPVRDAMGRIEQWFGTCTEIQSIVTAREVLALSQRELERQIELRTRERDRMWRISHDLMAVCRANGEILAVNSAATRLLGWHETDLTALPLSELIHPDDQPEVFPTLSRLGLEQGAASLLARVRARDGSYRTLDWAASAEDDLIYAVGRDVTEQRQLQEQLRQAQKMEAVGQLTGGIAHDFNNLLAGIMGSLDLLKRQHRTGRHDQLERHLDGALGSAQRAAALTQRLLAFSRRQPLDLQPTQVNERVASMDELLLRSLHSDIRLVHALAPDLWLALTDGHQLENALLNLVLNARDALPAGGTIHLETRNVFLEASGEGLDALGAGDYVALLVRDDALGMAPDVMARAFDPFFTTKPVGQGTGLGLSMIYGFAKQSRGHVRLESQPGQGTCVGLYLPRYQDEVLVAPTQAKGSGRTVLVVEDQPQVRQRVLASLRERGYTTLEAENARVALAVLEGAQPIDLLLSDVGLAGLNGRQLAEIARQRRPDLKVLFATGYAEGTPLAEVLDTGMALIAKPFDFDTLANRVDQMLGH